MEATTASALRLTEGHIFDANVRHEKNYVQKRCQSNTRMNSVQPKHAYSKIITSNVLGMYSPTVNMIEWIQHCISLDTRLASPARSCTQPFLSLTARCRFASPTPHRFLISAARKKRGRRARKGVAQEKGSGVFS